MLIYKYSAILAIPPHHACQQYLPKYKFLSFVENYSVIDLNMML